MESSINKKEITDNSKPGKNGVYVCPHCRTPLFEASSRFNAGCGFPSFWKHVGNNVKLNPLQTYGRSRIQLLCAGCKAHLGHLFQHKHTPSGVRYCINETAITVEG